ncbi:MAG: cyclic nucleotide-binding domain-containing protein [Deinococcota bacterium]
MNQHLSNATSRPKVGLSTIERVLFFKRADIFNQIAGRDLVDVARVAHQTDFAAGTTFIVQGDIGECLYLIVEGTASVNVRGVGEVARLSKNDVIGEMAIISREPRSADCLALTDMVTLKIDHDDFWQLLSEKPSIAQGVIRVLSGRLSDTMKQIQQRRKALGES